MGLATDESKCFSIFQVYIKGFKIVPLSLRGLHVLYVTPKKTQITD